MNTDSKPLGTHHFSHSYHIRKVGVIKVPPVFGWSCRYPLGEFTVDEIDDFPAGFDSGLMLTKGMRF